MSRKVREHRQQAGHIDEIFESCSAYLISSGNPENTDIDCTFQYDGSCEHCPLFIPPTGNRIKATHLDYKKGVGFSVANKRGIA